MKLDLDIIIYICSTIITICTAGGLVLKALKKSFRKSTEEVIKSEFSAYQSNIDEKLIEMNRKIEKFVSSQDFSNEQLKKAMLASTRDRINQAHDYYTRKRFIGAHSLFVVEELYTSYKQLGGNSFVDRQMEDIRELEVRSAETRES